MTTHRAEVEVATRALKLVLVMAGVLVAVAIVTVIANLLFT